MPLVQHINRVALRTITPRRITLRNFTMGSTDSQSAGGGNGKTNTWQGLGAAEFDLRSRFTLDISFWHID